ncbi:hypothetical protein V1478_006668, partial [Vespula squamosa]
MVMSWTRCHARQEPRRGGTRKETRGKKDYSSLGRPMGSL